MTNDNPSASRKQKVERFEELIAWQEARALTRAIYEGSDTQSFSKDYGLRDQIRRASVSIMSNIAEGFERGGRPEFHHFLVVAKGSCAEVRSQLYVALDVGYISQPVFDRLEANANEVGRVIGGLRSSVQRRKDAAR